MTAAAPRPMASWRRARRSGGPPDSTPTVAPVSINASPTSTPPIAKRDQFGQPEQERQDGHGRAGGEEAEAGQRGGHAGSDHVVALVDARRGRRRGACGVVAAQHLAGPPVGLRGLHPAGAVDERELVGVDVEARQDGRGVAGVRHRRGEQLALGAHRHELARTHRQRARQQPGEPGEQHGRGGGPATDHAEHQREVADEAVVGPEHGRAERARHPRPAPGREPAHHLLVDALVRGHRRGGVGVGGVGRAGLGPLREREHEHRAEPAGEEGEHPHPGGAAADDARSVAEEPRPVRRVALLGDGEAHEDLALLTGPPGRQIAVDPRLRLFVGEPSPPLAQRGRGGRVGHARDCRAPTGRRPVLRAAPPQQGHLPATQPEEGALAATRARSIAGMSPCCNEGRALVRLRSDPQSDGMIPVLRFDHARATDGTFAPGLPRRPAKRPARGRLPAAHPLRRRGGADRRAHRAHPTVLRAAAGRPARAGQPAVARTSAATRAWATRSPRAAPMPASSSTSAPSSSPCPARRGARRSTSCAGPTSGPLPFPSWRAR